ncbi:MAG: hypothetical protein V3U33_08970 [candidate division NC10 bacterium]
MFARYPLLFAAYMRVRELVAMVNIEAEDELEFDHIGDGALRMRRSEN